MGKLQLDGNLNSMETLISNIFIDEYMPQANGEFVKVYVYLVKALSCNHDDLSICHIADVFNHTDKDIVRALKYWEQVGLMDLCFDKDKMLTNITMKPIISQHTDSDGNHIGSASEPSANELKATDEAETISATPAENESVSKVIPIEQIKEDKTAVADIATNPFQKKVYTANELDQLRNRTEVAEFLYLAEKYIGKTLARSDINSLLYIYDVLNFSPDMIEYLIEYCVTNGHKSLRYIEKVALSWAEEGITNLSMAKEHTSNFVNSCYPVLKAFGISKRDPSKGEKEFIAKWTNTYGFNIDIIVEACNKTMDNIHSPNFNYADSILSDWKNKGVKKITDVEKLDSEHAKKSKVDSISTKQPASKQPPVGSFGDFSHRAYNYNDLEKKLLNISTDN